MQPPILLVEVIGDRELLPREKRRIESALRNALRELKLENCVMFSDLIDSHLSEWLVLGDGDGDVSVRSAPGHSKNN